MVGRVRLELTKAEASGFTARPLCRSGHLPLFVWPDGRPGWIRTSAPCGRELQPRAINHSATDPQSGQTNEKLDLFLEMAGGLAPTGEACAFEICSLGPSLLGSRHHFKNGYVGVHESSAETVGFEPTEDFRPPSLSKGVL